MPLPISDDEKACMLDQVFSLFTRYGFEGISMDEVAKRVKLSKATLYKYIESKENIVRKMVREMIAHMDAMTFTADHGMEGVLQSVSTVYFKAIIVAVYISPEFLKDLKEKFPHIYAEYLAALASMQKRFEDFHEQAVQKGYCNRISIRLVGEQIKMMLPMVLRAEYLQENQVSLPEVIEDYYRLLLCQLICERNQPKEGQIKKYLPMDRLMDLLNSRFLMRDSGENRTI